MEVGVVALPGQPTFAPGWGVWFVFSTLIIIGVVRRNHWAWVIATVLSVLGLVAFFTLLISPWTAVASVLFALSVGEVFTLFHRLTRQWTARPPVDLSALWSVSEGG
jgi:hypothetical protein